MAILERVICFVCGPPSDETVSLRSGPSRAQVRLKLEMEKDMAEKIGWSHIAKSIVLIHDYY